MKFSTAAGLFFMVMLGAFLVSIVFALPVKWLWNDTMPQLFQLPEIGIRKAWEIAMLSGILFKNSSVKVGD